MATPAHCAYAFEVLAANFERRQPLSLAQVEELWERYHASGADDDEDQAQKRRDDEEHDEEESGSGADTPASSRSSLFSFSSSTSKPQQQQQQRKREEGRRRREEYPLFVTWNTVSRGGSKSLRGCIGTFEAQELEDGLRAYALTSAFEDARFPPIPPSLLPSLAAHVTLLTNFSSPTRDPMDWVLGKHGLRISFTVHGRRYGATYLPDVAKEQGWTKEEALISLMRKAGWNGSSSAWVKTWREGKGELVRYEGKQVGLRYTEWRPWREWVEKLGVKSKPLN
ncbi:hypothetical protein BAUCODRAFT_63122 [Baudoinia panamericana UAMH 10762]|uniref:AMMECR1 domain-containing protein n=1 Tax=Baudoinia panamericana (strain UAMH 10762) TaxID=717646 RepID=M2NLI9_BAUPA|nr:uncharacterized protein BAUCODRAFT_63122 [Baudoinia panamericana UAMH 10762]EMD00001.1 hypothetical protein BAUCODRAFT_63122 [Baudoinia panamericana UAMH 10762]